MLKLMSIVCEKTIGVLAWLVVIIGMVVGFIIPSPASPLTAVPFIVRILGTLLGGVSGFIFGVLTLGPLAIISSIREHVDGIEDRINRSKLSNTQISLSSVESITTGLGDTWTCKECGDKNRQTADSCRSCGTYK